MRDMLADRATIQTFGYEGHVKAQQTTELSVDGHAHSLLATLYLMALN
jgi:hypothetical protein